MVGHVGPKNQIESGQTTPAPDTDHIESIAFRAVGHGEFDHVSERRRLLADNNLSRFERVAGADFCIKSRSND
jgi:hypothetical protein